MKPLEAAQTLDEVKGYAYDCDMMPDDIDAIVDRAAAIARREALLEIVADLEAGDDNDYRQAQVYRKRYGLAAQDEQKG